jgi:sugar lactone lactonase YvrE
MRRRRVAEPRVLLTGLAFGESPRWHDDRLWLSNWGAQEVVAVDLAGKAEVMARVDTTLPFSIDWDAEGCLLVVSGPERLVLRRGGDGSLAVAADLREVSEHAFNELVVDGRGNAYLNGVGFDMMGGGEFSPGLVALVAPGGAVRQVADDIAFPNGMAVTPDDGSLIVADSYGKCLIAFAIEPDGSLSGRRMWAHLGDGVPDGICLDAEGAVWYADVPSRRCVRVREGGEVLDKVELDRGCFACMLGGPDGRTLFMLAAEWNGPDAMRDAARTGRVLTVPAPAPHAGRP